MAPSRRRMASILKCSRVVGDVFSRLEGAGSVRSMVGDVSGVEGAELDVGVEGVGAGRGGGDSAVGTRHPHSTQNFTSGSGNLAPHSPQNFMIADFPSGNVPPLPHQLMDHNLFFLNTAVRLHSTHLHNPPGLRNPRHSIGAGQRTRTQDHGAGRDTRIPPAARTCPPRDRTCGFVSKLRKGIGLPSYSVRGVHGQLILTSQYTGMQPCLLKDREGLTFPV